MHTHHWRPLAALLIALLPALASAADFGEVEFVAGQVTLQTQDGQVKLPRQGDIVPVGAELVTGKTGELHIATADGGYLALRPNTRLRVAEFRAEGDDQDTQILSLLRGSFRSITGWIGKHNSDRYRIVTPTATIGVRGTDHEPSYIPEDADEFGVGMPVGTYDKVNEGWSYIESEGGRIDVLPGHSGFAPRGRAKPQRLGKTPSFFHATANERRILVRREQLRKVLEKRRDERREALKSRLERKKGRREDRPENRRTRN